MPFFAALIALLVFCTPAPAVAGERRNIEQARVDEAIPLVFSRLSHAAKDELRDVMDEMAEIGRLKKARRAVYERLQNEIKGMRNQSAKDEKQRRIDRLGAKIAEAERRQRKVLGRFESRHAEEQATLEKKRHERGQSRLEAEAERRKEQQARQEELEREKNERAAAEEKQRRRKRQDDREQADRDSREKESKPPQKKPCPPAQPNCRGESQQEDTFNTRPAPKGTGDGQNSGAGYPATTTPELLPAPPMELYRPHAP